MHSDGPWSLLKAKNALVEHRDARSREGEVEKANLSARSDTLVFVQDSELPDVSNCILRYPEHASGNNWLSNFSRELCIR